MRTYGAVELWNRLKSAAGLKLPTSAVFDHPTPKALAQYLASALDIARAPTTAQVWNGRVPLATTKTAYRQEFPLTCESDSGCARTGSRTGRSNE